jgi:hypothetical protein
LPGTLVPGETLRNRKCSNKKITKSRKHNKDEEMGTEYEIEEDNDENLKNSSD